jgi:hypothetical protein
MLLVGIAAPMLIAAPAFAATSGSTFVYKGQTIDTKPILDTGLQYIDGCVIGDDPVTCFPDDFPGTAWFRFQAGVKFKVITSQTADFSLTGPDTFRQDTTASFSTTLTAIDADGKEIKVEATPYVQADIAYDAPLADCPKDTIQNVAELEAADTSGCLDVVGHTGQVDLATFDMLAQDLVLPYSGTAAASETHEGPAFDVGALIGLPAGLLAVRVDVDIVAEMTATSGYHALRTIASSSRPGTPLASGQITWPSSSPVDDPVTIPCAANPGDNIVYKLSQNRWDGDGKVDAEPSLVVVIADPIPDISIGLPVAINLFDAPVTAAASPDFTAIFGEILPDAKPPVVGAVSAPAGSEGTPIVFSAAVTDNCGVASVRWDFSDGGVAYGLTPQHTFADNGVFSGQVTATDLAGNTASKDFSVTVSNVAPGVSAGPDDSAAWGRLVVFNGAATDPGAADQSTLVYSWDFGDGTPSANGGPSTLHSYASPADYTATLTVCDKNGACASDGRTIHVRQRSVTVGYLGPSAATFDTSTNLTASLIDEFGTPVGNRPIVFSVNGNPVGTADTGASGTAARGYTPDLAAGTYPVAASFLGDGLYTSSGGSGVLSVAAKSTSVTYTGALSGGPNKVVTLSANLVDATGTALSGRTIGFKLGTQTATAVTDPNGHAATTLKLNQKNGTYTVSATYAPAGADSGKYLGSAASATFKLQAK